MATGSDHRQHHAVDTKHQAQPVASPRSELVDTFIAYYSSADCSPEPAEAFLSHDLRSAAPLSSSSSSTAASAMHMRSAKKAPVQSSGQSTDSEHTSSNGSSESSSSLGDSAAAAARVLAAWQDRPLPTASTAADTAVSAGLSTDMLADDPAIWTAARASAARIQSSTSTPRQVALSFDTNTREGSAPVAGSLEATSRRADMGFLALLNSAAAYVAESSVSSQQQRQHHAADNPYLTHGDMLSDGTLTLSGINNSFGQAAADAAAEQGDYGAHYSTTLSSAAYQDLAQALQHIAATSSATGDGSIVSATAIESRGHGSYDYGHTNNHINTRSASAIRPDQIMSSDSLIAMRAEFPSAPGQPATSSSSKRKRKDPGGADTLQTPTKRKASHASAYPSGAATTLPVPPHSAEARRAARKWSEEETDNLLQGCTKYGVGAWKKILDDPAFTFNSRTSVDLKDRFRTIRAQECAHNPHFKTAGGGSSGKKSNSGKEPDVVWPLPPNSQRLQGLQRVQRKPTRNYTNDEDRRLLIGVLRHANHWTKIAADPDLKLGNRPGQSLRDRLRNAFPEVFELFGYVIPKKERTDREPCGSGVHQEPERVSTGPQRRKAPTGSKRLDGDIPENIKGKILAVLGDMNASLDPHPIPEPEDEGADSSYDADADGDPSAMDVDPALPDTARSGIGGPRAGAARAASKTVGRGPRRRSTVSGDLAASVDAPLPADLVAAASASREAARNSKRTPTKRSRSRSKTMTSSDANHRHHHMGLSATAPSSSSYDSFKLDPAPGTSAFPLPMSNDGGIHSAPAHADTTGCGPMGDLGAFSDCDHRRAGTLSAGAFGSGGSSNSGGHRNFMLESFAPSVFTRPMGTMTPTDQLDALALEGRFGSGYSTPTHSAKRRHSVQVDINEAMVAAAAAAAGMDRSSFSSSLHFFHPSVTGLDHHHHHHHATGASISGSLQMSAADTICRMTVGEPISADGYLFPRIPEDEATAAAAAAAAAADISVQMSSNQTVSGTPASDGMHTPSGAPSTVTPANIGMGGMPAGDMFKLPGTTAADSAVLTAAVGGSDLPGDMNTGYRGQLRSAQRLLRANGVADDNSIGLSTNSGSEGRVDLEALAQFSQWFPQFAPASLGWGMSDTGGQLGGSESIDPNMLDVGLNSAMAAAAATSSGSGGGHGGVEANLTHARRRSQYDWYGLTPSLAAALEAASTSTVAAVAQAAAAAAAVTDDGAMSSLGSFGLGQGSLNPSYRRPSMPIFPTFGYPHGDMLGISGGDVGADSVGSGGSAEQGLYGVATSQQDGGNCSAGMVATAAADAVAIALGEGANGGPSRARTTDIPGRRRTMHVPPSLLEGVATAEFGTPGVDAFTAQTLGIGPQQQQHGRLASAPYQLRRPVGSTTSSSTAAAATAAMTRGRRSRTISSNSNSQQVMARLGAAGCVMPSAARPPLPPVSEASVQFPLLSSNLSDMHALAGAGRHARSLSGTQLTQDVMGALAGVPMDAEMDAMTTLSAGDYSSSFKAGSLWPFGDDVNLAAAEGSDCAGMHDETRSLTDMRGRDAPALVGLYRPASSTPTGHRYLGAAAAQASGGLGSARNHSPALMSSGAAASPVAPRSAASTPGRREAVGM
ncbi:hypothetical protein GGI20_000350 [Coemansia sp. BCRC 34301]|nr:hypothetical protein GGI20_000350 [Coemansia sp. BCRC 34301]